MRLDELDDAAKRWPTLRRAAEAVELLGGRLELADGGEVRVLIPEKRAPDGGSEAPARERLRLAPDSGGTARAPPAAGPRAESGEAAGRRGQLLPESDAPAAGVRYRNPEVPLAAAALTQMQ